MGFFNQGSVDTNKFSREKLPCGPNETVAVYRVRITDFADHINAPKGDRTQCNFVVVDGPVAPGTRGSHMVSHSGYDAAWKANKARGEIAAMIGAFLGLNRDQSGFKVNEKVFAENSRTLKYNSDTGKVVETTAQAEELPLVKAEVEAFLVVSPYFEKTKPGAPKKRKTNPKTGQKSVTYELFPLSSGYEVTDGAEEASGSGESDDAPGIPDDVDSAPATLDSLALAMADGWKANGTTGYFYKKVDGKTEQLKEVALRAKYEGGSK